MIKRLKVWVVQTSGTTGKVHSLEVRLGLSPNLTISLTHNGISTHCNMRQTLQEYKHNLQSACCSRHFSGSATINTVNTHIINTMHQIPFLYLLNIFYSTRMGGGDESQTFPLWTVLGNSNTNTTITNSPFTFWHIKITYIVNISVVFYGQDFTSYKTVWQLRCRYSTMF